MEISACENAWNCRCFLGCCKRGSEDCCADPLPIGPPGDFLNEKRAEPPAPKCGVQREEDDLLRSHRGPVNRDFLRDGGDEANQVAVREAPDQVRVGAGELRALRHAQRHLNVVGLRVVPPAELRDGIGEARRPRVRAHVALK